MVSGTTGLQPTNVCPSSSGSAGLTIFSPILYICVVVLPSITQETVYLSGTTVTTQFARIAPLGAIAEMIVFPGATAVTLPLSSTVAILLFPDFQPTLTKLVHLESNDAVISEMSPTIRERLYLSSVAFTSSKRMPLSTANLCAAEFSKQIILASVLSNALSANFVTDRGTNISPSLGHNLNAYLPILVTLSGMATLVRFEQKKSA